jgi:uncharacterized membrane protein
VASPFEFDRTWVFDVPVARLWAAVSDTSRFPEWFPWLDGATLGPLEAGTTSRFTVNPPLPYKLHLEVDVQRVVPCSSVEGSVRGDVAGPARLEVGEHPEGSLARLVWSLRVQRPVLAAAERIARPVMVWGHDAVVARGLDRFRAVLGATTTPP